MSEDLIALLSFMGVIFLGLPILVGIYMFAAWIGHQIEARRAEPRKMVEAETKRLKAAIELEEKTIQRLELEVGTATEDDIDQALKQDPR